MAFPTFIKDPDATLDYGFDWANWLATGETITGAVWTVPSGITKSDEDFDADTTLVWLTGGTLGTNYNISCRITTSDGRIDDRTLIIKVRSR